MTLNHNNNQPAGEEIAKPGAPRRPRLVNNHRVDAGSRRRSTGTTWKLRLVAAPMMTVVLLAPMAMAPALSTRAGVVHGPVAPGGRLEAVSSKLAAILPDPTPRPFAGWPAQISPPPGVSRGDHAFAKGVLLLAFALMASGVLGLWAYLARAYAGRVRRIW